jgi:hypothetical protein
MHLSSPATGSHATGVGSVVLVLSGSTTAQHVFLVIIQETHAAAILAAPSGERGKEFLLEVVRVFRHEELTGSRGEREMRAQRRERGEYLSLLEL